MVMVQTSEVHGSIYTKSNNACFRHMLKSFPRGLSNILFSILQQQKILRNR